MKIHNNRALDKPSIKHRKKPFGYGEKDFIMRNNLGQFIQGNTCAAGHRNTLATKRQKLTEKFLRSVSLTDLKAIVDKLIEQAKAGNVIAAKIVLDRALGKVKEIPEPEVDEEIVIKVTLPPELDGI